MKKLNLKKLNLTFIFGSLIMIFILIIIMFPETFTDRSPYTLQHIKFMIVDGKLDAESAPFPPSKESIMGSDDLGRDIYSLIIYGTKLTILLGILIALGQFLIAIPMGLYAGFGNKIAGNIISQFNIVFSAIPALLVNIILLRLAFFVGLDKNRSIVAFIIVISITGWAKLATLITERVETINKQPFIIGEVAIGKKRRKIALENVIPHLAPELIVLLFMEIARSLSMIMQLGIFGVFIGNLRIIKDSANGVLTYYNISFEPEWASLLGTSRTMIRVAPWMIIYPALAFFISVLGFNLFGEGLRNMLQRKNSMIIPTVRKLLAMDLRYLIIKFKKYVIKSPKKVFRYIAILCLLILLLARKDYELENQTNISNLPSQSVIGTTENIETAKFIEEEMQRFGIMPLENKSYYFDYSTSEAFILEEESVKLKLDGLDNTLILNTDYAFYSTTGSKIQSDIINITEMDLFTLNDYDQFSESFVLIDTQYYNETSVWNFIDKISMNTSIKGFILISDDDVKIQQNLVNQSNLFSTLYINRDIGTQIMQANSAEISINSTVKSLKGKGRNIVGIYHGQDPNIAEEAILIGMNYNYLDENSREILKFNLDLMKSLCSKETKRSLIFMFYDGTLDDEYNGIHAIASDMPYTTQKIKVYIDLSKLATKTFDELRFSTLQTPVTRQLAWSIGHHLTEELRDNDLNTFEPISINRNGEYFFQDYYSDNVMFWKRGIATIHIGSVSEGKHELEELGEVLLKVINMSNY